jgi:hypothetical protein
MDNRSKLGLGVGALGLVMIVVLLVLLSGNLWPAPDPSFSRVAATLGPIYDPQPAESFNTRSDGIFWDGAGLVFYSDAWKTQTAWISGATGDIETAGDLDVTGDVDVTGEATLDVATVAELSADEAGIVTLTVTSDASVAGDLAVTGAIIGIPQLLYLGLGAGTDGTVLTVSFMDDTPDGEWAAAGVSTTVAADTEVFKVGTKALSIDIDEGAAVDEGATCAACAGGNLDLSGHAAVGFWIYATDVFTADDLILTLTDGTEGDDNYNTCVYDTAEVWLWCEVDITTISGTDVDDVTFEIAGGLPTPITIYIDAMYAWAAADEAALGVNLLDDGVLGIVDTVTGASLVEWTDYLIAWRDDGDSLVWVSDLALTFLVGLFAYE